MAVLTVQAPPAIGTSQALAYAAVTAADTIPSNDGKTWLHVKNGGGSTDTVTITAQVKCSQGFLHNATVAVPTVSDAMIGPFPAYFNDANGNVQIAHSFITTVTSAAIRTA